jgi:hypothetical protein
MTTKTKRRATIAPEYQPAAITQARLALMAARDHLRAAGCKRAADYAARALKSAEGAERHAIGMLSRGRT